VVGLQCERHFSVDSKIAAGLQLLKHQYLEKQLICISFTVVDVEL